MTELHLTPKQFGLVGSSFFLLFSLSAVLTGFAVNRIRSKVALLVMGLVWALVQFPMLGVVSLQLLLACRIVLGAGEGPAYPVALHATYKWFPNEARALPSAVVSQGAAVGVVLTIPLLNTIITHYNWHYAFGALGVAGLVWVAAWALLGAEGSVAQPAAMADTVAEERIPYRHLLLNSTTIACWCVYFSAYFGLALALSWFVPYLIKGQGFDQATAGKLAALPQAVGCCVVVSCSWLSQRMMRRGWSGRAARGVITGVAVSMGGLAFLASGHAPNAAMTVALIVAGSSLPNVVYILTPAILGEITPPSQRGAMLGIISAIGTSAGVIAPYAMGSLVQGAASAAQGYSTGYSVCGIVTLIGGLIAFMFLHPERDRVGLAARTKVTARV